MRTILITFLVVFQTFFMGMNVFAQDYKVDSVYNRMQGDWYKVINYQGLTGRYDTVASDEIHRFERIAGTDSVVRTIRLNGTVLTSSRLRIAYTTSNVYPFKEWMLTGAHMNYLISDYKGCLMMYMAVLDGSGDGLARTPLLSSVSPKAGRLSIYPNPVKSTLVVGPMDVVRIIDLNGRLMKSVNAPTNGLIDVSMLERGAYLVQLEVQGVTSVGKMIKE